MSLTEEMQSLVQEIFQTREDRKQEIAQLREEVKTELTGLARSRTAMASELRGELAKVRPPLARAVAEGKAAVAAQLKELDRANQAMGRGLRSHLAEGERKRRQEAGQFRGELRRGVAQGKAAAQARLRGFATTQAGAREEWQKLGRTMQARRGVAAPEVAEEEAIAKAEVVEVTPELAALRERVFTYLANHPDGTRMTELEKELGLPRLQMARVITSLRHSNKLEKRGLSYFAI